MAQWHLFRHYTKWCSAFEILFFSIGLADLVNEERRLREQVQQRTEGTQRELLQVQIQLNEDLDKKVHERTQALKAANSKLQFSPIIFCAPSMPVACNMPNAQYRSVSVSVLPACFPPNATVTTICWPKRIASCMSPSRPAAIASLRPDRIAGALSNMPSNA